MFKRKKKIQPTNNLFINNLLASLHESTFALERRVLNTYIANLTVNLYPKETCDKTKAEQDAEAARKSLLASIAGYDSIRAEITNEAKRLNVKLPFYIPASHSVIEQIMKRIICGGEAL